eukprot:Clim_evm58s11 gene=Clim_evmTU58s11
MRIFVTDKDGHLISTEVQAPLLHLGRKLLLDLNDDVVKIIFRYLEEPELIAMSHTCRRLRALANDNHLWSSLAKKHLWYPAAGHEIVIARKLYLDSKRKSFEFKQAWADFLKFHSGATATNLSLAFGIPLKTIRRLESELGHALPLELVTFYGICDGQILQPGVPDLFGGAGRLLSLEEAVQAHKELAGNTYAVEKGPYLPLTQPTGRYFLAADLVVGEIVLLGSWAKVKQADSFTQYLLMT